MIYFEDLSCKDQWRHRVAEDLISNHRDWIRRNGGELISYCRGGFRSSGFYGGLFEKYTLIEDYCIETGRRANLYESLLKKCHPELDHFQIEDMVREKYIGSFSPKLQLCVKPSNSISLSISDNLFALEELNLPILDELFDCSYFPPYEYYADYCIVF